MTAKHAQAGLIREYLRYRAARAQRAIWAARTQQRRLQFYRGCLAGARLHERQILQ